MVRLGYGYRQGTQPSTNLVSTNDFLNSARWFSLSSLIERLFVWTLVFLCFDLILRFSYPTFSVMLCSFDDFMSKFFKVLSLLFTLASVFVHYLLICFNYLFTFQISLQFYSAHQFCVKISFAFLSSYVWPTSLSLPDDFQRTTKEILIEIRTIQQITEEIIVTPQAKHDIVVEQKIKVRQV